MEDEEEEITAEVILAQARGAAAGAAQQLTLRAPNSKVSTTYFRHSTCNRNCSVHISNWSTFENVQSELFE